MTTLEQYQLMNKALEGRRYQNERVAQAVLKLQLMGLTPDTGMVECIPPSDINPLRWRGMIKLAWNYPGIFQ